MVFLVASQVVVGNSANAGCQYSHTAQAAIFPGGVAGRVAEGFWWTTGPVQRIYDEGKFSYYQVPSSDLPCNQPGCRGSSPQGSTSPVTILSTDRIDLSAFAGEQIDGLPTESSFFRALPAAHPPAPPQTGPWRPPRV